MNNVMYIAVNKEIEMSPAKMASQVGHAVASFMYNYKDKELLDSYINNNQPKIILKCKRSQLEKYEEQGYVSIRDTGKTELEPNTLTCVNLGIYDKDAEDYPGFIKKMQLYKEDSYDTGYIHGVVTVLIGLVKSNLIEKEVSDKLIKELSLTYKNIDKLYERMLKG